MKWLLFSITTAALGLPYVAYSNPILFPYTGAVVDFVVAEDGDYKILAFGAQGGSTPNGGTGGLGAEIGGDFTLSAGEILQIAVGGEGQTSLVSGGGGGGGGSFGVAPGFVPLVVAGAGGGAGFSFEPPLGFPGGSGQIIQGNGDGGPAGMGDEPFGGGGGGGFLSNGGTVPMFGGVGGDGFPLLIGGIGPPGTSFGGFGGGGSSGRGGGGGGGYSGGDGGGAGPNGGGPGLGGDSFDSGINQILVPDFQVGNGEVVITELPIAVFEPTSLGLLGSALFLFTLLIKRGDRLPCKKDGC